MKNRVYLYSTGTKEGPDIFAFPNEPMPPLFSLQISYSPSSKIKEMGGDISLQVFPLFVPESSQAETTLASGEVPVGGTLAVGDYMLTAKEVRYWVGMSVRHDPGKPFVLTSLWVGLIGMIVTFFGRMIKSRPLPTD
jgi:cytochrome c biogenesis protein ResB